MRQVSRRSLLGLRVEDCYGEEVGRVVDTWPSDGSYELQLVVVRMPRFGERKMLPADQVFQVGDRLRTSYSRFQVDDAPMIDGGRHAYDDPWRAKAYWMFEDMPIAARLAAPWRPRYGSSGTVRPSRTTPSRTATAS
jgi:hypothetical protein